MPALAASYAMRLCPVWRRWLLVSALGGAITLTLVEVRRLRRPVRQQATPVPLPPFTTWREQPKVSVLVAAWNEADNIDDQIRSFLALRYPNRELVLCAGGADDTFARAARSSGPLIKVFEQRPGEGKQAALRRVLPEADGSIVFLTDADCEFTDDAFLRTIAPIARGEAVVATGASEPKPAQRGHPLVQYQWFVDLEWFARRPPTVDGILGRNTALHRDVLEAIGGFDTPVRTGTDYVMGRLLTRSRYQIRSVSESRIRTEYPETPTAYLRMWRRWNKNLLLHGPRYAAWPDVRGVLMAFGLYGTILGLPALLPLLGPLALALSFTLFGVAMLGRYRRVAAGAQLAGAPISWRLALGLPLYTLLDMLGVLLAVADAVRPSTRTRW
jgi:cellulose synthase/poly-beta-1,6-N-acetylglucosamine synthase-like glycosyltransferase